MSRSLQRRSIVSVANSVASVASVVCLICGQSNAQLRVWPKPATAAMFYTINNVSDNVTLSSAAGVMKIHSNYVDSIRSAYRTVLPSYFSLNRFGTLSGALNAIHAQSYRSGALLVPNGVTNVTSTHYVVDPVYLRGAGGFNPKEGEWQSTGNVLKLKGLTIGVLDSTQGTRIEGISFVGDSVDVTKILLQKKRPQRQQTTLGYQGMEWNLFRNADSIGVEIVAPDNNTWFAHNRVDYNNGHGLVVRTNDSPYTVRGLNPMIAFNRFIGNDSCQLVIEGIQYAGVIGNGILGAQNNKPLLFFDGITRRMNISNLVLLNDMEQDAGGIRNAAAIKFNNGDLNGVMFNRIGQGNRGIELTGSGSRSLLVMHNTFTGIDTAVWLREGRLNLLSVNNRFGGNPTGYFKPHRDIVRTGGTLRYLDISSTDEGTTIDAGGFASNAGLKLNPFAQSNVSLFDSCASGVSRELHIWYHEAGAGRYKTRLYYNDGSFRIVPDSGFVRLAGEAVEIAAGDTNVQKSNTSGFVYTTVQNVGSSYPFNVSGHLIIQPRTSTGRDILFYTGSTTPSNRMVITRNGSVGIGGIDGQADSLGGGQGVIGLKNAAANPTGVIRDGVILYAKDVGGSSELVVRDESGTETVLSNLTSSGEANTASNVAGAGVGVFKQKSGTDLTFKRLKASNGISISDGGDSVLVAAKQRDWFWTNNGATLGASDNYNIWYTSQAVTVTRVVSYTNSGTYSFNLYWRSEASPNSGGTEVMSSTLIADTNAQATTSFADATIPANSWIAVQSSAHSGATTVGISITYTVD